MALGVPDLLWLAAALEPLAFPLDPGKRVFWGCLVSAALLASLAVTVEARRFDLKAQLRAVFDRGYWLHGSSAVDVSLMFLNHTLRVLLLVPFLGSHLAATLVVGRFLQRNLGDAPELDLPWLAIATIYSVTMFLVQDLSRFLLHLAMHRCAALWRFHRTHHSAPVLTPLTLFRVHPVEHGLYFLRSLAVFGLVSGGAIWLFGRDFAAFDILGVGLAGFLFNVAGANLRHSHVWLTFGRWERWFVSPAQHQLHHSREHGHCNLGSALALWDRIAGTATPAHGLVRREWQKLRFGYAN